jgi:PHD/YefM family antitoxin component YafN of YafNO toxin-antitoxin module
MSDVQYVTDANGRRTAVIVSIEEYEALTESYETPEAEAELDRRFAKILEDSEDSPTVSRDEVMAILREDG